MTDARDRVSGPSNAMLSGKQRAALDALNREEWAVVTGAPSAYLDSMDPEININTARSLVNLGLARFDRDADGLFLKVAKA